MTNDSTRAPWPLSAPVPPDERSGHAAPTEAERSEYIQGLKAQIRKGVYRPDVRELAKSLASMIVRDL